MNRQSYKVVQSAAEDLLYQKIPKNAAGSSYLFDLNQAPEPYGRGKHLKMCPQLGNGSICNLLRQNQYE